MMLKLDASIAAPSDLWHLGSLCGSLVMSCESRKSKLHDKRDKRDKCTVPKVVATSVARCYPVRVIPSPPEAFARWDSPAKRHAASFRCQTLNDRNKHQTVTNELILKESQGYSMLDHWFSLARIVCTILHLSGKQISCKTEYSFDLHLHVGLKRSI